jgi:hypothetical protein
MTVDAAEAEQLVARWWWVYDAVGFDERLERHI